MDRFAKLSNDKASIPAGYTTPAEIITTSALIERRTIASCLRHRAATMSASDRETVALLKEAADEIDRLREKADHLDRLTAAGAFTR